MITRGIKVYSLKEGAHYEDRIYNVLHLITKELKTKDIVKFDIFLSVKDKDEFQSLQQYINDTISDLYNHNTPALNILPNSSQLPEGFLLKCHYFEKGTKISYKKLQNHHYVTVDYDNTTEVISGGVFFNDESFLMNCQRAFDFTEQILASEDMHFGNIYKQVNYISDINEICISDRLAQSNWATYTQIQELFYEESLFLNGFPNIVTTGSFLKGLTIDFQAIKSNDTKSPIFSFKDKNEIKGIIIDHPVKDFWVSNCIGREPKSIDIEKQTMNALQNLFSYIDEKNLHNNDITIFNNCNLKENIKVVDAFVHNFADMATVEKILSSVFPDIPLCIIHAPGKNEDVLINFDVFITTNTLNI